MLQQVVIELFVPEHHAQQLCWLGGGGGGGNVMTKCIKQLRRIIDERVIQRGGNARIDGDER